MNYNVATAILLLIMGGIWLINPQPSPRPAAGNKAQDQQSWYTARELFRMTWRGGDRVPVGTKVEKISGDRVRYNGMEFVVSDGDLVSGEQNRRVEEAAARRQELTSQINEVDRQIAQVNALLYRSSDVNSSVKNSGGISGHGPTVQRYKSELARLQAYRRSLLEQRK